MRVEEVDHVGEDPSQGPAGLLENALGDGVLERREADEVRVGAWMGVRDLFADRVDGDDRLDAPAVPASTQLGAAVEPSVADLAGEAGGAVVRLPANDRTGADAVRDLDVEELREPASCTPFELTERAEEGVLLGVDGQPDPA